MKPPLILVLSIVLLLTACRKDDFISSPDASVRITADTLHYDTVFTSTGSVTKSFKIINENNRRLRLTSVSLAGGSSSVFKINVDGVATSTASGIELAANDSIYVFVQVNVDPSSANLPFVLRDSISIGYNGVEKQVQLEAWGQNAHFIRDGEVTGNESWTSDLPYVILGYLRVNENSTLTLGEGCRLYFHANAPLVVNGSLRVNGAADSADRVYFMGDRMDEPYRSYPAGWPGIYFSETSSNNLLRYAVVRNAYQAVVALGTAGPYNLELENCIIDNAYDIGLLSVGSSIRAENLLVSNCGKNIVINKGGSYAFSHCTIASFSNRYMAHQYPVMTITDSDGTATGALDAVFSNCIFWGDEGVVDDEVVTGRTTGTAWSLRFDHVLWRQAAPPAGAVLESVISNQDPLFFNTDYAEGAFNFRVQEGSPAINSGKASSVNTDLDGRPRPEWVPDLGAYES
ncbi:MAG: hypothetical protein EOO09_15965 [Chitinophagaceae bacterium]|nr:MAG: hypothetical protein EOO09_15965 [Chitinophagaceae bacterium]